MLQEFPLSIIFLSRACTSAIRECAVADSPLQAGSDEIAKLRGDFRSVGGAKRCASTNGPMPAHGGLRLNDHQRPSPFLTTNAGGRSRTGGPSGSTWVRTPTC